MNKSALSLASAAVALAWAAQAEPLLSSQQEPTPLQDPSSEMGGIVLRLLVPSDAQAPSRIDVTVSQLRGGVLISRSLSGGYLELGGIAPGDYRVQIEASGFQTVDRYVQQSEFVGANLFLSVPLVPEPRADHPASGLKSVVEADVLRIPKKALRQLEKATQASDAGRLEKALSHLGKAIGIHPEFHQAYNNRGAVYLRMHDYPKAESDLRQALQIDPASAKALRNLGWLLLTEGRYEEAAECLQELSQLKPQDAWPHTYWGESLFQLGRYREAAARFRRALALDPTAWAASYRLGAICLHYGDKEGALAYWRQFLLSDGEVKDPSIEKRVRKLESELERQRE